MSSPQSSLSGLARRLVNEGHLSTEQVMEAAGAARREQMPLVRRLVGSGLLTAATVARASAEEFGDPVIDLDAFSPDVLVKDLVDTKLIARHTVLPLYKRGSRLFVAVSDPTNLPALEEIRFNTGLNVETVIVEDDKLTRWIDRLESEAEGKAFADLDEGLDNLDVANGEPAADSKDESNGADDAPIVRFVNKLLLDAIKGGASDLHFEPYEKTYRVRFRQDGVLQTMSKPPINSASKIAARLKVMARLDISERRVPQDGRIKLKISKNRAIDFRVNTCPTLFGEKIVLRILDPDSAKMGIDALGYEPEQKDMYMRALNQPQGMILVTGPTGSGKTVSLYTGVNILNTPERNISTAEDPVEINLEGINQVNVNPRQGLDFSSALRAFLRQDPDVILVGEIRDLETAEIAVKAAQTGHLVLSTLHTNSAPETLTRLRNMGVPSFNIATSVSLIIAQRLARRLCSHCKEPVDVPKPSLLAMGFTEPDVESGFTVFGPKGCQKCNNGYRGRVGIYEVVRVTDGIARIIMQEGNSIEIADQCRKEGFNDLRRSGLLKVMQGVTSLEEMDRVTSGH
ncbi:Type IV-A pilus assembly ATPase PilB [Alloalcanivorax dieselolei B5]|uniref:Type IV-A pilus assembly ATPase PilB n=1 Tax=Alcanivorax dieselolei (strain DSM 16502 / CGMCC 1.3690 / MCCC 1A00001 / B-5) TaxID=930169 RepID=K0CDQ6_ALCDB|nr:type IV-A pilus assembly ATPase PilB [Alloalcanivorax dieselolei]AFT71739.1 Type IV-A pilus assembly ATPase PilB [Alloalcanivorax dieselolei B5]GGK02798.1 type 4 fimbrial assembly protein PilB [Alloalcanivorax dieselolei]